MLRDDAVAMIKMQLGFRQNQDANIVTCLQMAQQQLELQPTKPWFLVSDEYTQTLTIGTQTVSQPADWLEEVEDSVFRYVPDGVTNFVDEVDLWKDDYDVLRRNFRAAAAISALDAETTLTTSTAAIGAPKAYAVMGSSIYFFPVPDAAYTVRFVYYAKDTVLSSNIENKWLKWAPYALMGKAGQLIANGPLRDAQAAAVFLDWERQGTLAVTGQNIAREMANRRFQVGGAQN